MKKMDADKCTPDSYISLGKDLYWVGGISDEGNLLVINAKTEEADSLTPDQVEEAKLVRKAQTEIAA